VTDDNDTVMITVRLPAEDRETFYQKCRDNRDGDGSAVMRRLINDYIAGRIRYGLVSGNGGEK
jgi:hypothetical protein